MSGAASPDRAARRGARLLGAVAAFVAFAGLVRALRPALLLAAEPAWALPRLLLGLAVAAGSAGAGALAAGVFLAWSRTTVAASPLFPLAVSRRGAALLAAAAVAAGAGLRFAELARSPEWLWVDDVSLVAPTLGLAGRPGDFADAIRPVPWGAPKLYGSVGVLYLEGYRMILRIAGTSVFGVRLPSALAGALSVATGALLARAVLPRGGGALAALALAGLRWSLVLSRWGWNMIALAPLLDAAALAAIRARRRDRAGEGLLAGAVAGVGAHVYLAAWPAGAALAGFAAWPKPGEGGARLRRGAAVLAGFVLAAAPLFVLREGRRAPYFARARDHSLALEMRRQRSAVPALGAAADAVLAPWGPSDPSARNDLPGRARLGWILGVPAALAFGRALARPRDEISAFLLCHAAAAGLAAFAGGEADQPNGSRFAYLTTVLVAASSAGALALAGAAPPRSRRAAALAAAGLFAVSGAFDARDALRIWPEGRATFEAFHGQDTLLGRAAARWAEYGAVAVAPGLAHSPILVATVARFRLDPDPPRRPAAAAPRRFRVVAARDKVPEGFRTVERLDDPWGRSWGAVMGARRDR